MVGFVCIQLYFRCYIEAEGLWQHQGKKRKGDGQEQRKEKGKRHPKRDWTNPFPKAPDP